MKKKRNVTMLICSIFAFVFMIPAIVLAILSNKEKGFNLFNILSLVCIFIAACFVFIPMIVNNLKTKKIIKQMIDEKSNNPAIFADYIIQDYRQHNLQLSLDHIEKQYLEPLINENNELAIRYHTLFVYQKNILIFIEVYFLSDKTIILFDEGKEFMLELSYENQTDTKDFYYQISLKIKEQLEKIITNQTALKD